MSFDFVVHPIHLERFPLIACDLHACSWLTLQSRRGLAPNTLDAYSRALERYLEFLKRSSMASATVIRGDVGLYLAGFHASLSNATVQQMLTVVRLFHAYLMEEGVRSNNPVTQTSGGHGMVARHHKLPWIRTRKIGKPFWLRLVRSRSATEPCSRSPMMPDFAAKSFAVCRQVISIRPGACSGFARRPPRAGGNGFCPIRYPAARCSNSTRTSTDIRSQAWTALSLRVSPDPR